MNLPCEQEDDQRQRGQQRMVSSGELQQTIAICRCDELIGEILLLEEQIERVVHRRCALRGVQSAMIAIAVRRLLDTEASTKRYAELVSRLRGVESRASRDFAGDGIMHRAAFALIAQHD